MSRKSARSRPKGAAAPPLTRTQRLQQQLAQPPRRSRAAPLPPPAFPSDAAPVGSTAGAAPPPPAQGLRFFHPTAERALVPRLIPQDGASSSQLTNFINAIAAGDGAAITTEVVTELLRTWSFAVVCEAFREGIQRWHEPYAAVLARHEDPSPAPDPTARSGEPR